MVVVVVLLLLLTLHPPNRLRAAHRPRHPAAHQRQQVAGRQHAVQSCAAAQSEQRAVEPRGAAGAAGEAHAATEVPAAQPLLQRIHQVGNEGGEACACVVHVCTCVFAYRQTAVPAMCSRAAAADLSLTDVVAFCVCFLLLCVCCVHILQAPLAQGSCWHTLGSGAVQPGRVCLQHD